MKHFSTANHAAVRRSLLGTAGALFVLAGTTAAWAQSSYPTKPIKIIAPYPPGGFTDVVTRQIAARLTTSLGQTVFVENKPGAGTNIGAESVAHSPADGYTLLMGTSSLAINKSLYRKLNYDPIADFKPLGVFATTGYTLIASKNLPANTTAELVAYAKAKPDALSFGSSGNGAVNHLAGELFGSMAGIKMLHVPYRGSQAAITDLVGGQIQLFWASTLEAMPMIKADRVKPLGVTNKVRVPAVADVPPLADAVKDYEVLFWMGLFAPSATPKEIVDKLVAELHKASGSSEMAAYLNASGASAVSYTPAEATTLLEKDIANWGNTVRRAGATVD